MSIELRSRMCLGYLIHGDGVEHHEGVLEEFLFADLLRSLVPLRVPDVQYVVVAVHHQALYTMNRGGGDGDRGQGRVYRAR